MLKSLYQVLLVCAVPWVLVRLRWRARKEPEYGKRIRERFGHVPQDVPNGPIWFHTVSAGETIAAASLIRQLTEEFTELPFLVTTMTPTGSAQVRQKLNDCVSHCYAPYDFRWGVKRFFDAVQPRLLVLVETELWPNMIDEASKRNVPVLLVNARLSERSAQGYGRVSSITRHMMSQLHFVACQFPDHAERFIRLGADPSRVDVLGSVKFDVELTADHDERVRHLQATLSLGDRPVWIAGSTHPSEEEVVLAAHRLVHERHPDACLLLVPRHPSRTQTVVRLARQAGFRTGQMSAIDAKHSNPSMDVIVADTMGQLLYLYGLSEVAFIGGSLVPAGGHNPIEAAICAKPLLMGPEVFNFRDVVAAFHDSGALQLVHDAEDLAANVAELFADTAERKRRGEVALQVVADNTGTTHRLLELLRAEIHACT
ncbi:MAG: lipid IV(A) 3-deoxy-D-manno-octulosonic acid transferase [Gammaproteobacteria bacterium]|nr:lipid IV(A) 3-deoxy-D-manno-octulosonic acid transferase [Gammaproteobacteria bacterium]